MLEKTDRAIKNGQSRDTGNSGYTRQDKVKQNKNIHHNTEINKQGQRKAWRIPSPKNLTQ
jgi:hypothetical protein